MGLFFVLIGQPVLLHAQSTRPGWGSTPYNGGVTFRVWAPNATNASVAGTFNGWSTTASPLVSEGTNGVWSADVAGVPVGAEYKYFFNGNLFKRDPRSRKVVSSAGNSIVYDPNAFDWTGDDFQPVALKDAVIYEMHIGSFNDPSPSNGSPGTFYDAINKLDYLYALGVNAVEVMPIAEFAGDYSWGYNPADPFAVENFAYGGPDGFKSFVKACHARGIAVLLDTVHNHYGNDDLDLWNFDGWAGTNAGGGIYFYQDSNDCCTAFGPRPNYSRQPVREYIKDNTRMWMDEYRVDGFRWDVPCLIIVNADGTSLLQDINTMIRREYVGKINIAESCGDGLGYQGSWDFNFVFNITDELVQSIDANRNVGVIAAEVFGGVGLGRVVFVESHDQAGDLSGGDRLPKRIDAITPTSYRARKLSGLGALLALTSPGVPMMLQGEEMLETRQFSDGTPIDWSMTNTNSRVVQLYRDAIRLRRNLYGTTAGLKGANVDVFHVNNGAKIIAYRRWDAGGVGDDVVVAANFSSNAWTNYNINFPAGGTWNVHFNSDLTKYGADYTDVGSTSVVANVNGSHAGAITIGPYSMLIFSQAPLPATDTDGDGMPDAWEIANGLDPNNPLDGYADPDGDGLSNLAEYQNGTDPNQWEPPRASYSGMTVGGTFNGWNPTPTNMTLVDHYRWQYDASFAGETNVQFKFAVNGGWGTNWGDSAQTLFTVPMTGLGQSGGSNIAVAGTLNGIYRFTFWEKTGNYRVQQLQSVYSNMTVAGTFNGWNPTLNNMHLIDDYTWQAQITFTNASDIEFKFTADGNWTTNWGDNAQGQFTVPLSGLSQLNGLNIRVTNTLDGLYRFTFNEQTQVYQLTVFNSKFSSMTVAGTFNGWNPGANNMKLVADYTWQYDMTFANLPSIEFKFAAKADWSANWGDNKQVNMIVPLNGTGDWFGTNIFASGPLTGNYRFTFDDRGPTYRLDFLGILDKDGDGMPDWWEVANNLNMNDPADAARDDDGDGFSNVQEFTAGTNPKSAASAVRISSAAPSGADFVVSFPSVATKLYRLEYTDNLMSPSWQTLSNNIAGTGGPVPITDPGAAGQSRRFYRIKLLP